MLNLLNNWVKHFLIFFIPYMIGAMVLLVPIWAGFLISGVGYGLWQAYRQWLARSIVRENFGELRESLLKKIEAQMKEENEKEN